MSHPNSFGARASLDVAGTAYSIFRLDALAATPGTHVNRLPVSLRVFGPWAAPRIYPDIADILSKPEQAYERLRAMGLQQQQPQLPAPAMPN